MNENDMNKVINQLLEKIARLEYDNAILNAKLKKELVNQEKTK